MSGEHIATTQLISGAEFLTGTPQNQAYLLTHFGQLMKCFSSTPK